MTVPHFFYKLIFFKNSKLLSKHVFDESHNQIYTFWQTPSMNWEQNHRAHGTYKNNDVICRCYKVFKEDIKFKLKCRQKTQKTQKLSKRIGLILNKTMIKHKYSLKKSIEVHFNRSKIFLFHFYDTCDINLWEN